MVGTKHLLSQRLHRLSEARFLSVPTPRACARGYMLSPLMGLGTLPTTPQYNGASTTGKTVVWNVQPERKHGLTEERSDNLRVCIDNRLH